MHVKRAILLGGRSCEKKHQEAGGGGVGGKILNEFFQWYGKFKKHLHFLFLYLLDSVFSHLCIKCESNGKVIDII
jgi:hypothetical protein